MESRDSNTTAASRSATFMEDGMPYEIRSAGVTREAETMEHAERIAIHLCAATRAPVTIWRDGREVARIAQEARDLAPSAEPKS